ncbi:BLUF domain-containing protein [Celeribacter arenosi]|uniref:BLUF domain-containing protein n=1 Tax=Celeribacter arenosi TaxID=792649 RepID=A0ABP7K8S4_9RHOB
MLQLLYRSVAINPELDSSDIEILRAALVNNRAAGVTGYLWRAEMQFFQVLHGTEDAVRSIFARILKDPRHHSIEVLHDAHTDQPTRFSEWSMGYDIVGADILGVSLQLDGTRPPISPEKAMRVIDEMAQAARDASEFGGAFPFARKPKESEGDYIARLARLT